MAQSTGLATLGQVIAQAGSDYRQQVMSDRLRDEQRQQQLDDYSRALGDRRADVASERSYQEGRTDDARKYQDKVTETARKHRIIDEASTMLIRENLLPIDWAERPNSQEMYAAASNEARRRGLAIDELAQIRAAAAEDFTLSPEEKSLVFSADPRDPASLERARAVGMKAMGAVAGRAKDAYTNQVEGQRVLGTQIGSLLNEKTQLQAIAGDTTLGPKDSESIEMELQKEFGVEYPKLSVKDDGRLAEARKKKGEMRLGIKLETARNAARRIDGIDNQIVALSRTPAGVAANIAVTPAATPPPPAPLGDGTVEDFNREKNKGKGKATQPTSPGVSALYDEGGLPAVIKRFTPTLPQLLTLGTSDWIADNAKYIPGTLNYMAGGAKRFQEGEAERDAQTAAVRRTLGLTN